MLSDTTASLALSCDNIVANEIVKKILMVHSLTFVFLLCHAPSLPQTIAHTTDTPVSCLVQSALWPELIVLLRFLLALSFNNKINGNRGNSLHHVLFFAFF